MEYLYKLLILLFIFIITLIMLTCQYLTKNNKLIMNLNYYVLLVTVIFFLIILIIIYKLSDDAIDKIYKLNLIYSKYNLLDNIKIDNCDILLYKQSPLDIYSLYINFTHCSLILNINNIPFIVDMVGENYFVNYYSDNISYFKLEDRVNDFYGSILLLKLRNSISDEQYNKIINYLKKMGKIKFPRKFLKHYLNNCILNSNDTNNYFCSEFYIKLLIDCNIVKIKNDDYRCFIPDNYINLPEYYIAGFLKIY